MILGKLPFVANISSFISQDGNFNWSLRFQHQHVSQYCYQCTINQSLFEKITAHYQFASPQKFFDLIKGCLFEGKGLKGLGYYFGEHKKRAPDHENMPLILEVTVDLYSLMKFTLILDPVQKPSFVAMEKSLSSHDTLMQSLSPMSHNPSSFSSVQTQQQPGVTLSSIVAEMRQLKLEKEQEKERVHALMKEVDRLKTVIGNMQEEIQTVKKGVRALETNELRRASTARPVSQGHQPINMVRGAQPVPDASALNFSHQYGMNVPQHSSSYHEFKRQVPQQVRPHSMMHTDLKAHLQHGVRFINNKTTIFSEWNRERSHSDLILTNNQKTVRYNGTGNCVSTLGNVLYLEGKHEWVIRIDSVGKFSTILIGIADPSHDLDCKCGSTKSSYGLSVQDGKVYHDGSSRTFTNNRIEAGSVISVILDLINQTLAFRINGEEPVVAYNNVSSPKVPCISLGEVHSQISLQSSGLSY